MTRTNTELMDTVTATLPSWSSKLIRDKTRLLLNKVKYTSKTTFKLRAGTEKLRLRLRITVGSIGKISLSG